MSALELKPTHKPVQTYYAALCWFHDLGISHDGALKPDFHGLLDHCARRHDWTDRSPNSELRMTNGGQTTAESQSVRNSKFVTRTFPACRSPNPNLADAAVEEMLIRHLLT